MATSNPFIRGYQDLHIRRDLLITNDSNYQPIYRQLAADQEDLSDDQLAGHYCVFGDTHALVIEPEEISEEQDALYPTDGQVRAVVYAVRASETARSFTSATLSH